ncbi:MAG: hypothetical protein V2A54_03445 [Bacteroidota bacterium]
MKKIIFSMMIIAGMAFLSSCGGGSDKKSDGKDSVKTEVKDEIPADAKYGIKTAIVDYEMETMGMKMNQTLYIDAYGTKESTEVNSEMEMFGQKIKTHNLEFTKDGYKYSIDLEKKMGNKMKMIAPPKEAVEWNKLSDEVMKKMNIKKEGTEAICGVTCDIYSIDYKEMQMKGKNWVYKGISMKSEMTAMGFPVKLKAVKFQENVAIPADKFEVPKDVKITDVDAAKAPKKK